MFVFVNSAVHYACNFVSFIFSFNFLHIISLGKLKIKIDKIYNFIQSFKYS